MKAAAFVVAVASVIARMSVAMAAGVPYGPFGGNQVDVTTVGMQANNGFDNSAQFQALLNANGAPGYGIGAWFPSVQTGATYYYFSQAMTWSRVGKIQCGGAGANGTVALVFASGVNGIIQESAGLAPDSSTSNYTEVDGCKIYSNGWGQATDTNGSNVLTGASFSVLGHNFTPQGIAAPTWAAGDGIIAIPWSNRDNQPLPLTSSTNMLAVPSGTYLASATGSAGNQTLTLAGSSVVGDTDAGHVATTIQLPAALTYSVTTTSGTPTVTITAGPAYKLQPGDLIWSDAFPFGAAVWTISGSSYPYTLTISDVSYGTGTMNAAVTHASGSGKLWLVPSGLSRKTQGKARNNYFSYWPVGVNMVCSAGRGQDTCTGSSDNYNFFQFNIIGHLNAGADSGASVIEGNIEADNNLADMVEAGTVASLYLGNNSNCEEGQRCPHGVIGNCTGFNNSIYVGEYNATFAKYERYCISGLVGGISGAQLDLSIPTGLSGSGSEYPMMIAPIAGFPSDANVIGHVGGSQQMKTLQGQWAFDGGNIENGIPQGYFTASANSSSTTTISTASLPCFASLGYGIADATNPAAIPGGTTVSAISGWCQNAQTLTTSVATTVLAGDQLYFTTPPPCVKFQGGYSDLYVWEMREACGQSSHHSWVFDGHRYGFTLQNNGGAEMMLEGIFAQADNYGDGHGYVFFPRGFKVASNDLNALGAERIFDFGAAAPAWTSGLGNKQGNIRMSTVAGSGQAAGWYDTADGLNFKPFGLIANDAAGASYVIGTPVAIASLPTCTGTSGARATVNNGIAAPTYHQAVSTTGSTVQPVVCAGGTGWIYD